MQLTTCTAMNTNESFKFNSSVYVYEDTFKRDGTPITQERQIWHGIRIPEVTVVDADDKKLADRVELAKRYTNWWIITQNVIQIGGVDYETTKRIAMEDATCNPIVPIEYQRKDRDNMTIFRVKNEVSYSGGYSIYEFKFWDETQKDADTFEEKLMAGVPKVEPVVPEDSVEEEFPLKSPAEFRALYKAEYKKEFARLKTQVNFMDPMSNVEQITRKDQAKIHANNTVIAAINKQWEFLMAKLKKSVQYMSENDANGNGKVKEKLLIEKQINEVIDLRSTYNDKLLKLIPSPEFIGDNARDIDHGKSFYGPKLESFRRRLSRIQELCRRFEEQHRM